MGQYNILVVDDDPDILTIIKDNLELDGYKVFTAALGKDALSIFKKEYINLIILDLMLPDMDGIQICRATRINSHVPIIMLTAKDSVSDKVLGLESGADDYIVKPFDYLELAARVKAQLRRIKSYLSTDDVFQVGNLKLKPARRELTIDGAVITLTKKEFDILSLLFRHAGKALDRDTIKMEIWPEQKLYKWSRTLDVHIQRLRAKLEKNPEQPRYILTIPGIGYMLSNSNLD
ncbi:MAG: response regulator transcription factor [Desulfobacterales bacterium]|nr:response regulator transcription factor [Desulfobacterales bacterium]